MVMNEAVTPAEHNRATVPVDIVGHVKHPLCAIITDDREWAWYVATSDRYTHVQLYVCRCVRVFSYMHV